MNHVVQKRSRYMIKILSRNWCEGSEKKHEKTVGQPSPSTILIVYLLNAQ